MKASNCPLDLLSFLFVKKETVRGIIGNTQGVTKATMPPKNPSTITAHKLLSFVVATAPQLLMAFPNFFTGLSEALACFAASPDIEFAMTDCTVESKALSDLLSSCP